MTNYNLYLNTLKKYAKLHQVKLCFKSLDKEEAEAIWLPSARKIVVDLKDKSKTLIISNLLHELGHFSHDNGNRKDLDLVNKAYDRFNNKLRMTSTQKNRVLLEEIRAWEEGEKIANKLKIPTGRWYKKWKKEAVNEIKEILCIKDV